MEQHKELLKKVVELMKTSQINHLKMTVDFTDKFEINIGPLNELSIEKLQ